MGGCSSTIVPVQSPKKSKISPIFQDITNDTELNNLFKKLDEDLNRMKASSQSWKQSLQKLNNLLGIQYTNPDIHHLIRVLIATIASLNKGEQRRFQNFNLSEKSPYFSGNIGDAQGNIDVQQFLTNYQQFIDYINVSKGQIMDIIQSREAIESHLNEQKKQNENYIKQDDAIQYNVLQMKQSCQKVNLYHKTVIQPILDDHRDAVSCQTTLLSEATTKGDILHKFKIYNFKKISDSILASAKTTTSI